MFFYQNTIRSREISIIFLFFFYPSFNLRPRGSQDRLQKSTFPGVQTVDDLPVRPIRRRFRKRPPECKRILKSILRKTLLLKSTPANRIRNERDACSILNPCSPNIFCENSHAGIHYARLLDEREIG